MAKIVEKMQKACEVLELIFAAIIGIVLIGTIIVFIPEIIEYFHHGATPGTFFLLLEEIFSLVVGVEFLKLLCQPNTEHVVEVLIFLIARHMIIGSHSAVDNLLSVVAIVMLLLVGYFMKGKISFMSPKKGTSTEDEK